MSTLRHPVGPHSKKIYWRRRAFVLAILVAIIAIVVLIVVRPGASAEGETQGASSVAPATDDAAGSEGATDGAADTSSGAAASDAEPGTVDAAADASGEVPACAAGNIAVAAVTDADTYPAGTNPQLSFTIQNTGAEACKLNAGTSQQLYTITSGEETYWVSTDCQTGASDTEAVLEPGVVVASTPFGWDRTRSSTETCEATDRPQVPAAGASYHLNVQVAGITAPDSKQFILQ
ncbi:hypothetical protein ACEXQD_18355 [Herbiconiux sp. P15]|uniref:hypothetical protein n=1 Tax=Herbiconiux liukaitaii TaxID=3342799 RepID=UPI0035B72066